MELHACQSADAEYKCGGACLSVAQDVRVLDGLERAELGDAGAKGQAGWLRHAGVAERTHRLSSQAGATAAGERQTVARMHEPPVRRAAGKKTRLLRRVGPARARRPRSLLGSAVCAALPAGEREEELKVPFLA